MASNLTAVAGKSAFDILGTTLNSDNPYSALGCLSPSLTCLCPPLIGL
jgi:hypothetical protein